MLDPISDTPLVLAYAFMSLLVLILCFIFVNVIHKVFRTIGDEGMTGPSKAIVATEALASAVIPLKTTT